MYLLGFRKLGFNERTDKTEFISPRELTPWSRVLEKL
jgi:hypothetical protein